VKPLRLGMAASAGANRTIPKALFLFHLACEMISKEEGCRRGFLEDIKLDRENPTKSLRIGILVSPDHPIRHLLTLAPRKLRVKRKLYPHRGQPTRVLATTCLEIAL
jgi:hypothetical protein